MQTFIDQRTVHILHTLWCRWAAYRISLVLYLFNKDYQFLWVKEKTTYEVIVGLIMLLMLHGFLYQHLPDKGITCISTLRSQSLLSVLSVQIFTNLNNVSVHCQKEGNTSPKDREISPRAGILHPEAQSEAGGQSQGPRRMCFPIHTSAGQCTDTI